MGYRIIIDRFDAPDDVDRIELATAPNVARDPERAREAARQCPMGAITVVVESEVETR